MTAAPVPVVVGLGAPDRGDDAVGPLVVREVLAALGERAKDLVVVDREDPTSLIELWSGCRTTIVVDAVRSGSPPGTVHVLRTGPDLPPLGPGHQQEGGTHDFGLASAVELARALNRLPEAVHVVGVEARSFGWGDPLSREVAEAVPAVVAHVLRLIDGA